MDQITTLSTEQKKKQKSNESEELPSRQCGLVGFEFTSVRNGEFALRMGKFWWWPPFFFNLYRQ